MNSVFTYEYLIVRQLHVGPTTWKYWQSITAGIGARLYAWKRAFHLVYMHSCQLDIHQRIFVYMEINEEIRDVRSIDSSQVFELQSYTEVNLADHTVTLLTIKLIGL